MKIDFPGFKNRALNHYKENESFLELYEDAISKLSKQKQKAVRDIMANELVRSYPIQTNKVVWTGKGDILFFDSWSKTRFYSDYDIVEGAINKANHFLERGNKPFLMADLYHDWLLPKLAAKGIDIGFTSPITYELKTVDEGDYVNNVILFITRPHNIT